MSKLLFERQWNGGVVRIEADSVSELSGLIKDLMNQPDFSDEKARSKTSKLGDYPTVAVAGSCKASITDLLNDQWGKMEPRTEAEITGAMRFNSIHYPRGTISAVLAQMAKRGDIRRVSKKEGAFAYVLVSDRVHTPSVAVPRGIATSAMSTNHWSG